MRETRRGFVLFGRGSWAEARRIADVLRQETVGGALLLAGAVLAMLWANSPWGDAYFQIRDLEIGPAALHLDLSLATWAADGLLAGGVLPVMKHVPGHGRAFADSHKELPRVDVSADELRGQDFLPFRALNDLPMAMTAHVVYSALDPDSPATTSRRVVEDIIRGEIGFDGLLMSDDISMHALSGDFGDRVDAILAAGCDVVLHCNGVMEEMRAVANRTPELAGKSRERAEAALLALRTADDTDEAAARAEFAEHFALVS